MNIVLGAFSIIVICFASPAAAEPPTNHCDIKGAVAEIQNFALKAGTYPPAVATADERKQVIGKYLVIKKELDSLSQDCTNVVEKLLLRAKLETMGHNLDIEHAWNEAESDFREVLRRVPQNVEALLGLGFLYVNTNLKLAPQAELLFLQAQKSKGAELLVSAHRGLIFAYYYQGKMEDAKREVDLVRKFEPNNKTLAELQEIIRSKL